MTPVWCVQYRSGGDSSKGESHWCAVKGEPSEEAIRDDTLCGHVVTLRLSSEVRLPDCPECLKLL